MVIGVRVFTHVSESAGPMSMPSVAMSARLSYSPYCVRSQSSMTWSSISPALEEADCSNVEFAICAL